MKLLILTLFSIIIPKIFYCQNDKSKLLYLCKYQYSFKKDSLNTNSTSYDEMNLEIYQESSFYYSKLRQVGYNKSLDVRKKELPLEEVMKINFHIDKEGEIIIYNYAKKQFQIYDKLSSRSEYKTIDTFGIPKWNLQSDTMTILSQLCQKATTKYRGRNYTAWFSSLIPYQVGPWKLQGLPGLIIKAYDDKNQFAMECISLSNTFKTNPVFTLYTNAKPITLNKLKTLKKLNIEDRQMFLSLEEPPVAMTMGGKVFEPKRQKKQPYNPLDLTQ